MPSLRHETYPEPLYALRKELLRTDVGNSNFRSVRGKLTKILTLLLTFKVDGITSIICHFPGSGGRKRGDGPRWCC